MTAAQAAVVNEALESIAAQTTITDLNDGTVVGNAAGVIYAPIVQMALRLLDPDFARKTLVLALVAGTPVIPYAFEYTYPADCLRTRQVRPLVGNYDPLDPQPVLWAVALDGANGKVILTNLANAALVYTSSSPIESQWDAVFREWIVGKLAVPLSMAVAGRPDFARALMEEEAKIGAMSEGHEDGI